MHCGLEAYVGFPRIVLPGIHISLDVTWKQPCSQWLCQGFSKILPGVGGLPKPARLQGGISLKGFTFNVGFIGLDGQSVPSLGWKHKFEPIVLGVPNIKFPNITMPKLSWPKFTWPSLGKWDAPNAVAFALGIDPNALWTEICDLRLKMNLQISMKEWITLHGIKLEGTRLALHTTAVAMRSPCSTHILHPLWPAPW